MNLGKAVELVRSARLDSPAGLWVLASIGYGLAIAEFVVGYRTGMMPLPGGDLDDFLRSAGNLFHGGPVYVENFGEGGALLYGPPWVLAYAALSLLPGSVAAFIAGLAELLALRYIVGSWRSVGLVIWIPFVVFELVSGQINLLLAAAIVAAWRGPVWPLALGTLAKIGPILALPVRKIREFAISLAVIVVLTLPFAGLWVDWITLMARQPTYLAQNIDPGNIIDIPWLPRLVVAVLLAIPQRSWLSATAGILALPALHPVMVVMLLAPLRLFLDERRLGARARVPG